MGNCALTKDGIMIIIDDDGERLHIFTKDQYLCTSKAKPKVLITNVNLHQTQYYYNTEFESTTSLIHKGEIYVYE